MFQTRLGNLFIAAVVSLSLPADVQSQEAIREFSLSGGFNTLATQIHAFTTSEKIISGSGKDDVKDLDKIVLRVVDFSVADKFRPSRATKKQLANKLSEALIKRKVKIAKTDVEPATHVLKGECRGDTFDGVNLELIFSLVTTDGVEVDRFRASVNAVEVFDHEEVASILGLTVDATPAKPKSTGIKGRKEVFEARKNKFKESMTNPTVAIISLVGSQTKSTIIAPEASSKFKIELLVINESNNKYSPIPAENLGGFATVGLSGHQRYAIRIYNDFDFDLGAKIALDGINCLELSEIAAFCRSGVCIIPRKSTMIVNGWHVNDKTLYPFLAGSYPDKVARKLGGPVEGISVIQAQFFPAWSSNEPQPFEELAGLSKGGGSSDGLAIGPSENIIKKRLTRFVGETLLGAITVRYTQENLPTDLPIDLPTEPTDK